MMKKSYCALLIYFLPFFMFLQSCSVKEQRDDCPCYLVLDFSEVDEYMYNDIRVFLADSDKPVYEHSSTFDDVWPEYAFYVPRSQQLSVNIYSGEGDCFDESKGIMIPYGEQCPRIYMYSTVLDTGCETLRDTVCLHKNHCVLDLYLEKEELAPQYDLCIKGNICGYGMKGQPVRGEFSYRPAGNPSNGYQLCIPRQSDASLVLEIDDGSEVLKTFALGEYIVAGGYDWDAPDLEDLTVHVNWTYTNVILTISGWDWVYECEIVI